MFVEVVKSRSRFNHNNCGSVTCGGAESESGIESESDAGPVGLGYFRLILDCDPPSLDRVNVVTDN